MTWIERLSRRYLIQKESEKIIKNIKIKLDKDFVELNLEIDLSLSCDLWEHQSHKLHIHTYCKTLIYVKVINKIKT